MKLSVKVAFFLFYLGTYSAWAEELRAVVLESQGDRVVINRGKQDGVKVGQTWILGPDGKTGVILIEEAGEHSAAGRLSGDASVGVLASLGKESDRTQFAKAISPETELVQKSKYSTSSLDQLRKRYKRAVEQRTEQRGFTTKLQGVGAGGILQSGQAMNLGVEAYNAYRLYDITNSMGLDPTGLYNPWWLAASAVNVVTSEVARKNMNDSMRIRVDAEVTHWDEELVDLQTEVSAAEEGLSLAETMAKKVHMHHNRGVDEYTVFEVRLKNVGKLPAETGAFKYKMFLMSNEGRPISASLVDAVLDKGLQPGDEVRGMVYFPKIVAAGQSTLKVSFEQMYGDRGDLQFSVR